MEILSASFLGEVCLVAQRAGKVGSEDRHEMCDFSFSPGGSRSARQSEGRRCSHPNTAPGTCAPKKPPVRGTFQFVAVLEWAAFCSFPPVAPVIFGPLGEPFRPLCSTAKLAPEGQPQPVCLA